MPLPQQQNISTVYIEIAYTALRSGSTIANEVYRRRGYTFAVSTRIVIMARTKQTS